MDNLDECDLSNYQLKKMTEWENVNADVVITDPPFGIEFDGNQNNYARNSDDVVDGYVEWEKKKYRQNIKKLLNVSKNNTTENGQCLIFSGWNNSHIIAQESYNHNFWNLEGKLYWNYNFAPYCTKRPAHNVYEIYWLTNGENWYYKNKCSFSHCQDGEANLSAVDAKRKYLKDMPKYPTRLTPKILKILIEHFSDEGDKIFDPLAGSGMVGLISENMNRNWKCGDVNANGKKVFKQTLKNITD